MISVATLLSFSLSSSLMAGMIFNVMEPWDWDWEKDRQAQKWGKIQADIGTMSGYETMESSECCYVTVFPLLYCMKDRKMISDLIDMQFVFFL